MFKTLALGIFLITAAPVPELEPREVEIQCNATHCVVTKPDMEYIIKRDQTLSKVVSKLSQIAKQCNVKDI